MAITRWLYPQQKGSTTDSKFNRNSTTESTKFWIYIKKTMVSRKVCLRGALIKRRGFLWIWKILFQCRKKESCLPNKTFSLKRKNNVWGSFREPIEILFTFCRIFGDSDAAKKGGNTGGEGWLLKIPWDLPCMRVVWKLLNTFRFG